MIIWLSAHLVDILLVLAVLLVVGLSARSMILAKKAGRYSCGCNCSNCAMSGACHAKKSAKQATNLPNG